MQERRTAASLTIKALAHLRRARRQDDRQRRSGPILRQSQNDRGAACRPALGLTWADVGQNSTRESRRRSQAPEARQKKPDKAPATQVRLKRRSTKIPSLIREVVVRPLRYDCAHEHRRRGFDLVSASQFRHRAPTWKACCGLRVRFTSSLRHRRRSTKLEGPSCRTGLSISAGSAKGSTPLRVALSLKIPGRIGQVDGFPSVRQQEKH